MVRQGIPETVPENCGTAGGLGVCAESIVTCPRLPVTFLPNLLHLSVFSSAESEGSEGGEGGLNSKDIVVTGREAMVWSHVHGVLVTGWKLS